MIRRNRMVLIALMSLAALSIASCDLFAHFKLVGTWEREYSNSGVETVLTYSFDSDKTFEYDIYVVGSTDSTTLDGTYSATTSEITISPDEEYDLDPVTWDYSIDGDELTLEREDDNGALIVHVYTKVD